MSAAALLLVAPLLVVVLGASASAATGNLYGTVYTHAGVAAANTGISYAQQGQPGQQASTDGTGAYDLTLGDGTWTLVANPPGGDATDGPTSVTVVIASGVVTTVNGAPGAVPVDIHLAVANITGSVFLSGGTTPANGAWVFVQNQMGGSGTNENGQYALYEPDGTWTIVANPPMSDTTDAATSVTVVVAGGVVTTVNGAPGHVPVDIHLAAANVYGTVFLPGGTSPASNSWVSVQNQPNGTSTDQAGYYRMLLGDGTWTIVANPPMNDTTDAPTSVTIVIASGVVTTVNGAPGTVPVNIQLSLPNLHGTVFTSAGPAAAGAQVFVQNQPIGTNTDQSGKYRMLLGDGTWTLVANPPQGDATDAATSVTVVITGGVVTSGANQAGDVNITLVPANLYGTVYTSGHAAAANTGVSAFPENQQSFPFNAPTDQNGHYSLSVPDGTWLLMASPPMSDAADAPTSVTVVVANGVVTSVNGNAQGVPVNITLVTANVVGTVFLPGGTTPAANSSIFVQNQPMGTNTDQTGQYRLHLPDGSWTLVANPPMSDTVDAPTTVTVVVANGVVVSVNGNAQGVPVNITLSTPNLKGTVFLPDGKTPAANSGVSAFAQNQFTQPFNTFTDQNGYYRLAVPDGTWNVVANPPMSDTADAQASVMVVVEGGVVTSVGGITRGGPVDLTLLTGNLFGTVYTSTHDAAPNSQVGVQNTPIGTGTDPSGQYRLHVPDGTWTVTASPPMSDTTDAPSSVTVVVASGVVTSVDGNSQGAPVDITLATPNLSGTVFFPDGKSPAVNSGVAAFGQDQSSQSFNTFTDGNGQYRLRVPDGTWTVNAAPPMGDKTDAAASVMVVVEAGVVTSVDGNPQGVPVDLTLLTANLYGTVQTSGHDPASNTWIGAAENPQNQQGTGTDIDGHYAMFLTDGTWSVTAFPPQSDTLDVPTSVTVVVAGGVVTSVGGVTQGAPVDITLSEKAPTSFTIAVNGLLSSRVTPGTSATLAESGLPGDATGTVVFSSPGQSDLCTITLPDTSCTTSTSLPVGSYAPISAAFVDTDGAYLDSTSSNTVALTVSTGGGPVVTAPPAPPGALSSASATSTSDAGTATATDAGVTASATGTGGVTVAQYGTNPEKSTGFTSAGVYFDVAISSPNTFSSVTITECNLKGGSLLFWWNGTSYVPVSPAATFDAEGCLTFTVTSSSAPSLSALAGTVFAVGSPPTAPAGQAPGYWFAGSDGGVFAFGDAQYFGSMGGAALSKPVVGMAATPDGKGYWLVAADGGVFAFGDAQYFGSMGGAALSKPVVGMAATPDGKGYWLVAADGGVFAFGDAAYSGSMGATALSKPVVGMATTADGKGYWLVAADGGVFAFGDAAYSGSMGATALSKPVVGMATTADGKGYWLVAADGGVFAFGDAAYSGSMGATALSKPVVGMATTADGGGYWLVAADGGVFTFGDAAYEGSLPGLGIHVSDVVGMAS
jgi:hypothetical protein